MPKRAYIVEGLSRGPVGEGDHGASIKVQAESQGRAIQKARPVLDRKLGKGRYQITHVREA